jgi:hypothetical protein
MTDETIHSLIQRRRRELTNRIAALRSQLKPLEQELAEVDRIAALANIATNAFAEGLADLEGNSRPAGLTNRLTGGGGLADLEGNSRPAGLTLGGGLADLEGNSRPAGLTLGGGLATNLLAGVIPTIKTLVIETLRVKGDATTEEIREFIREGFGQNVAPDSLRPQLSRLKADGVIRSAYNRWSLVQSAASEG